MAKSKVAPLLYVLGGALALKLLNKNTSSDVPATQDDYNFLDSITEGAAAVLATITGTKEPNFVTKMKPIAAQIQAQYGIDPLITITQSALESGWGLSGLTAKANNLFGFTGDTWAKEGKSVIYMKTHEYSPAAPDKIAYFTIPGDIISKTARKDGGTDLMVNRPFRAYPTWYDSVADWAQLLRGTRYVKALQDAKDGNLEAFARDVAAAGYATEPDYATQLVAVGTDVAALQTV